MAESDKQNPYGIEQTAKELATKLEEWTMHVQFPEAQAVMNQAAATMRVLVKRFELIKQNKDFEDKLERMLL